MKRTAFLGAAAAIALPTAAWAQTESRVSADVSANAGYSNNPFSIQGNDTGAAVVSVDIAPRLQVLTARSTLTVSADATLQQYLRRYGNNNSVSGALDWAARPSERVTTHARIDLSSAILGSYTPYVPVITGVDATGIGTTDTSGTATGTGATTTTGPTTLQPIISSTTLSPFTDVGLYGLRSRRKEGRASGDIGLTLSARDSLSVAGYAEVTRYSNFIGSDYEAYGGSLNYSRRVSSRWSVGLLGSGSTYHYHIPGANSQSYSVQATASGRLNDRWSVNGALGVSFIDGGVGLSTNSTSVSGNLSLCRSGALTNLCLTAARQVSPTGYAGSQYVSSAGASWSRRLDERQSVSLGASYSHVDSGNGALLIGGLPYQSDYVQTNAGYNRRLGQRLSLTGTAYYRQLLGGNDGRPADFGGLVGLSYRLGDRR